MFKTKSLSILVFIAANWAFGVFAAECETDPTACSIKELCSAATTIKRNHLEWNFDALDHVASAKSYGLTCGVDNAVKPAVDKLEVEVKFKKYDFTSLNQLQRHQIQYALKRLGYYSSSVDGLWGKGTERAANKFLLDENIKGNLAQNLYKALTSKVNVSSVRLKPVVTSTTKTTASSDTSSGVKICRMNDNAPFERMLTQEEFEPRPVKELGRLREIEISDGTAIIGPKKIKQRDNKTYTVYTNVRCTINSNGWSRCGSFTARAILRPRGTNGLSGKLYLPSEWPLYNGSLHRLEYTCDDK